MNTTNQPLFSIETTSLTDVTGGCGGGRCRRGGCSPTIINNVMAPPAAAPPPAPVEQVSNNVSVSYR